MIKEKIVVFVGRENWESDIQIANTILQIVKKSKIKFIWDDPVANLANTNFELFKRLGVDNVIINKLVFRLFQFFYAISHFDYLYNLFKRKKKLTNYKCFKLTKTIKKINENYEIIIISRSLGGRVASLVADDFQIKKIICLGYPFKHPKKEEEPERFAHLSNIKTPMLIIQGLSDEYGGIGIENKYKLSKSVSVFYAKTNHGFEMDAKEWVKVKDVLTQAINY